MTTTKMELMEKADAIQVRIKAPPTWSMKGRDRPWPDSCCSCCIDDDAVPPSSSTARLPAMLSSSSSCVAAAAAGGTAAWSDVSISIPHLSQLQLHAPANPQTLQRQQSGFCTQQQKSTQTTDWCVCSCSDAGRTRNPWNSPNYFWGEKKNKEASDWSKLCSSKKTKSPSRTKLA